MTTTIKTSRTSWRCKVDTSGHSPAASLTVSINGGTAQAIVLKGVAYSPCPLNGSNANGPNLGDWFWDSAGTLTGWSALWARDLPVLRPPAAGGAIGANCVRVYSMLSRQLTSTGGYPVPWNSGRLFTHTAFLDACWNDGQDPVYVLVGIPLPQAMFWQMIYNQTAAIEIDFWTHVLQETVTQVANHPAVVGFIIQNEQDASGVTYGANTGDVQFWWNQVEAMAAIAGKAAPDKLVGMAVHDDPNICGQAASYMAEVPSLDFWGVNTYQTQTFSPVFGATAAGPGYAGLTGAALKPVFLTEWGIPATGYKSATDPSTIYDSTTTIASAAEVVTSMVPQAFAERLLIGLVYFEYCDEWGSQGGSPNISTWYGGPAAGFPHGYRDQDGFGLYSIRRGSGLADDAAIWVQDGAAGAPNMPIDVHTERTGLVTALSRGYRGAAPSR